MSLDGLFFFWYSVSKLCCFSESRLQLSCVPNFLSSLLSGGSQSLNYLIAKSYFLKVIPCPSSIYINVYDLYNAMIISFMDSKELLDSDLCAIALLHQDTAAIIITLHRSIIRR